MDIINLTIFVLLIALTGFFVATEFAIVKVRMTRINQFIEEGKPGAIAAKKVVTHLDEYLSACQLGITITALGLGALSKPAIQKWLQPVFDNFTIDPTLTSVISYAIAFAIVTFLHVVVGELAPKTIAIQKAESVTLLFAVPIIWFYRMMFPAIWLLNGSARLLLKTFGLKQASEHEVSHSEEELRMILSDSFKSGEINQTELTYVNNIFSFDNRIAKEIMVPRPSVVAISLDDTLSEIMEIMDAEEYTRYPIFDGDKDNIVGILNIKDMLNAQRNFSSTDRPIPQLMKPIIKIIETIPINKLLRHMQKERTHIAVLYDEYGGTSGIVTVEDILEEIVGDIRDEYDTDEEQEIHKLKEKHFLLKSTVLIEQVNDLLGTHISASDVDTIGGWFLTQKYEVEAGDSIIFDDFTFTIKSMDGYQILFIKVEKAH